MTEVINALVEKTNNAREKTNNAFNEELDRRGTTKRAVENMLRAKNTFAVLCVLAISMTLMRVYVAGEPLGIINLTLMTLSLIALTVFVARNPLVDLRKTVIAAILLGAGTSFPYSEFVGRQSNNKSSA